MKPACLSVAASLAAALSISAAPAHAAAGDLDTTCGGDGTVTAVPGGVEASLVGLAAVRGGYAGTGRGTVNGMPELVVLRWRENGSADRAFGTRFVPSAHGSEEQPWNTSGNAILAAPANGVVAAGVSYAGDGSSQGLLASFGATGERDGHFGAGGVVEGGFEHGAIQDVVREPDGALTAVGFSGDGLYTRMHVGRYAADGAPDATFGVGGAVSLPSLGGGTPEQRPQEGAGVVALRPGGFLVGGGFTTPRTVRETEYWIGTDGALVALTASGELDPSFGDGGVVRVDYPDMDFGIRDLVTTSDGGSIAIGTAFSFGGEESRQWGVAMRFDRGGALDPAFGEGGMVTIPLDQVVSVALDEQGRALVSGTRQGVLAVARLTTGGAADPAFGDAGVALAASPDAGGDEPGAIIADGSRVTVAGTRWINGSQQMVIARFLATDRR